MVDMGNREQIVQLHECPNCGALVSPFMRYAPEEQGRLFLGLPIQLRFWRRKPAFTPEGVCTVCGLKRTEPPPEKRTPAGRLL